MENVFTGSQELSIMIVQWFPSCVTLRWTQGSWCIAVEYFFVPTAVAKFWHTTLKQQRKRRRESIMTSSNLGNVQMADICFERNPMYVEQRSYVESPLVERNEDILRFWRRDERDFFACLQNLERLSCTSRKLQVLRITIPCLCYPVHLQKISDWIVNIQSRSEAKIDVSIDIPFGLCVISVNPNGGHKMGRFRHVLPYFIRVLNNLLYKGVRLKSFTYIRYRWIRKHSLLMQRARANLPLFQENDLQEI